jgi:hypothetical protein
LFQDILPNLKHRTSNAQHQIKEPRGSWFYIPKDTGKPAFIGLLNALVSTVWQNRLALRDDSGAVISGKKLDYCVWEWDLDTLFSLYYRRCHE